MKIITQLYFNGQGEEAIQLYREAFGYTVKTLIHYEEVIKAFQILAKDGEIIKDLEKPPYMVIIGEVRDRFGVHWILMCDFS